MVVFTPAKPGSLHPSSHTYYYYQILQIMAGERSGWFRNSGGVDPRFVRRDSRVPFGLLLYVTYLRKKRKIIKGIKRGRGLEWSGVEWNTYIHRCPSPHCMMWVGGRDLRFQPAGDRYQPGVLREASIARTNTVPPRSMLRITADSPSNVRIYL